MKIIQVQKGSLCNNERTFKYLSGLVNSLVVFVVLQGSDFMTTLQELWYGNIRPNEDKVFSDEEKKLIELMAKHHEKLSSSLKNDELVVFEKYANCFTEYDSLIECQAFEIGFKLAVKILTESR